MYFYLIELGGIMMVFCIRDVADIEAINGEEGALIVLDIDLEEEGCLVSEHFKSLDGYNYTGSALLEFYLKSSSDGSFEFSDFNICYVTSDLKQHIYELDEEDFDVEDIISYTFNNKEILLSLLN